MSEAVAADRVGHRPQRLYLHIGLPKSGTTFLQAVLAANRGRLKELGFIYPFVRPECMFHAAVELRRQHERWGLSPELVDGTWQQLLERVRAFDGDGVISHELLAGAMGQQIARVAGDTGGLDLHLVVTARDLGRQATAHWQEQVKNGRSWSFETFRRELFEPSESEEDEDGFWRSQDLCSVLRRWGAIVPPENVHVVVVPRSGSDRLELWRRFAEAVGLDPAAAGLELHPRANESLGAAQVALLREVVEALDGRLRQPHYAHVVKRFFAQEQLSTVGSPPPVTPADLVVELDGIVQPWIEEIGRRGVTVHGDLAELLTGTTEPAERAPHPDEVSAEEMMRGVPRILAELLLEIASLRGQVSGPKALPPLTQADVPVPEPREPLRRRLGLPGRQSRRRWRQARLRPRG